MLDRTTMEAVHSALLAGLIGLASGALWGWALIMFLRRKNSK